MYQTKKILYSVRQKDNFMDMMEKGRWIVIDDGMPKGVVLGAFLESERLIEITIMRRYKDAILSFFNF